MRHRPAGLRILWRILGVMTLCAGGLFVGVAPAAWASCAANPPPSPMVFTGTVMSTERDGLIARVQIDDRHWVTVVGTPSDTGVTTVDRTFEVGVRYEFHPLNATDPFQDNICTRTHAISSAGVPPPTEVPDATQPPSCSGYRPFTRVTLPAARVGRVG